MRSGFTLLEVLVAVMVAATLLLSADFVFTQLADSSHGTTVSSIMRDSTRNSMEAVREWVRQIDVSPQRDAASMRHAFSGDSIHAQFTSACISPGGWEVECSIALGVETDSAGATLTAISSAHDTVRLRRDHAMQLRYLAGAAGSGSWESSWPAGPTLPLAIGMVTPMDTVIYRIGARG